MSPPRRVLLVKNSMQPPGGGQAVAAWMLEALKGRHELGLLTWTPVDLDDINRFYGTSLRPSNLAFVGTASALRPAIDRLPMRAWLMRQALLLRAARRLAPRYDVVVGVDYEVDFGRPGIQYINLPLYQRPRPTDDVRWYHGPRVILDAYFGLADHLSGMTQAGIRANHTYAVSDWIGERIRQRHGIAAQTLYPPIPMSVADVPWHERRDAFLCIGRISPEKQIHRVIDIIERVRRRVPSVTLCLVGTFERGRYGRDVRRRIGAASGWISTREWLSRAELLEWIPTFKYGIHGMLDEHFGMAPAEMAAAGCIVFVPRDGGQVEIVAKDPRLTYTSIDEAADRIVAVLENPDEQRALRRLLASQRQAFDVDRFVGAVRSMVECFPEGPPQYSTRP